MASRINVESELWDDPRLAELFEIIGKKNALGSLIELWALGQAHWKKNRSLIPEHLFRRLQHSEQMLQTDFARLTEDGVYCSGAKDRWDFLLLASKAGRRSAEVRKSKFGTAQPRHGNEERRPKKIKKGAQTSNGTRTGVEQASNGIEPSSSSSSSSSKKEDQIRPTSSSKSAGPTLDFEQLYSLYPKKEKKKGGMAICKASIKTIVQFESLRQAIMNYVKAKEGTEYGYLMQWKTFMGCWDDWVSPTPEMFGGRNKSPQQQHFHEVVDV